MSAQREPAPQGSQTAQLAHHRHVLQRSSRSRHPDQSPASAARFAVALYFALVIMAGVVVGDGALGIGMDVDDVGLGWTPGKLTSASASSTSSALAATSGTTSGAPADRGVFIIAIAFFVVGLVSALLILLVIYLRRIIHTRTMLAPLRSQNPSLYWRIVLSNDDPSLAALGHSTPAGDTLNLEALQKLDIEPAQRHPVSHSGDTPQAEPCAVCLEPLFTPGAGKVIRRLPCGHRFHTTCVDAWLVQRRGVCPVCRRDLTVKDDADGAGAADCGRSSCETEDRASSAGRSQDASSDAAIVPPPATQSALVRLTTRLGLARTILRLPPRSDVEMGAGVPSGQTGHVAQDTRIGAQEGPVLPSRGELEGVMLVHSVAR